MKCKYYKNPTISSSPYMCSCDGDLPDQWIDVRDELPKEDGYYHVYFSIRSDFYFIQEIIYFDVDKQDWHIKGIISPTHWIPLLDAPTSKEK